MWQGLCLRLYMRLNIVLDMSWAWSYGPGDRHGLVVELSRGQGMGLDMRWAWSCAWG